MLDLAAVLADRPASAPGRLGPDELSWNWGTEGRSALDPARLASLIDDLARIGVRRLAFAGPAGGSGYLDAACRAASEGLETVFEPYGPVGREGAGWLRQVGISLVRLRDEPDFEASAAALKEAGLAFEVRRELTVGDERTVYESAERWLALGASRAVFVHPARGDWTPAAARAASFAAIEAARHGLEVALEGLPADGPYLVLRLTRLEDPRAARVGARLLRTGEARDPAGFGAARLEPDGTVRASADWDAELGNVLSRPFSQVWLEPGHPDVRRVRRGELPERCHACLYAPICGGGSRARAAASGDPFQPDPLCTLSRAEILGAVGRTRPASA